MALGLLVGIPQSAELSGRLRCSENQGLGLSATKNLSKQGTDREASFDAAASAIAGEASGTARYPPTGPPGVDSTLRPAKTRSKTYAFIEDTNIIAKNVKI